MAKAKKSQSDETPKKAAAAKPAGKPAAKSTGSKSSSKSSGKPSAGGAAAPSIDTNLAASTAAAMILNRSIGANASTSAGSATPQNQPQKKESAAFKQLKQNIAKPAATGPGGILSNPIAQRKSNQPFGGPQQKGHNQTFGADVNRAGVPRRTGGG